MKKYLIKILVLFLIVPLIYSCGSISKEEYLQNIKNDKIIYDKENETEKNKLFPSGPIDIYKENKLVGTIKLGRDQQTLFFVSTNGESKKIWRYYDYSGVDKITQSNKDIIRIFYWEALIAGLFGNKEYVTEFNFVTLNKTTQKFKNMKHP